MPTIAEYLKYANLQMAAEALLYDNDGTPKPDVKQALIDGNNRTLKFTASEAEKFLKEWEVVAQIPNTPTGFSGTLFWNSATKEYVISFRSTESIDDAIRDNAATNKMEIHETGWAWGQISDMETWYNDVVKAKIPAGAQLNVTGYSLGGHLATAFNILHHCCPKQIMTLDHPTV
jgi:hypothetical protein